VTESKLGKCNNLEYREKDADPDAAVASAAYWTLKNLNAYLGTLTPAGSLPLQTSGNDWEAWFATSLATIPDGAAKEAGIALGKLAADAIMQNRANDNFAQARVTYIAIPPPVTPLDAGVYRPTVSQPPVPSYHSGGLPLWSTLMKPFTLTSNSQFRSGPPPSLTSATYTNDYNEVKQLGCLTCTGAGGRTQDQENIAKFWVESSAYGWNKVAKAIIEQKKLDAWKTARLFALLQMSVADAYIACLKAKMTHFFWRPYTAILLGDNDGNPNTVGDPTWQVLVSPIPPIADHPSAHAAAGGAAAELLKHFFENDNLNFSFESSSLPGNARSFGSLSQAARENSLSRIYVGYHFRKACMDGEALGKSVGGWIGNHSLQ